VEILILVEAIEALQQFSNEVEVTVVVAKVMAQVGEVVQ